MDISSSPRTPQQQPRNGATASSSVSSKIPKLGDFSQLKASRIPPTVLSLNTSSFSCSPAQSLSDRPAKASKRAVKLFDLDHPVLARLQLSQSTRACEPPRLRASESADPTSPSPVPRYLAANHHGSSPRLDPYVSATDEDIPVEDSDGDNDVASHASTPATSPATSVDHHVEEESSLVSTHLLESALKKEPVLQPTCSKQPNLRSSIPPSTREAFLQQISHGRPSWSQLQRLDRIRVADIVAAAAREFTITETVNLPWDRNGNFIKPHPSEFHETVVPRDSIEPLYRVNKKTKLQILKAAMKRVYDEDARIGAHPWSQAVTNEPIHVYVDLSNIIIGFYNHLKTRRYMPADTRIRAPPFSFHAFTAAVERGRSCARRAVAGSVRAGSGVSSHMYEAWDMGYEMNILQRVRGTKKSVQNLFLDPLSINNYLTSPHYVSDSDDSTAQRGWREQAVDEILHLKMMQSLLDTQKPATIVLCTGDAAEAEFSDGFLRNVERALRRGWYVEVVGWRDTMADAWFDKTFRKRHGWRFRTVVLDALVEEMLAMYGP